MKLAVVELVVRGLNNMSENNKVPIWEKLNLTLKEAAEYSNIGINRLASITSEPNCPFVLFVGNKKLIKRIAFEKYINSNSIHYL